MPVAAGELGEAVLTGLCSEAQPFVRYRTGDLVRLGNETCREGRGLHVIGEVVGRSTDFVVRPDGTIMHALAVVYVCEQLMASRNSGYSARFDASKCWSFLIPVDGGSLPS
jgi:phenylacetate-coenzyme A ligase PaaK-like adenylate-forming protein